jgi:hypothetical protein
VLDLYAGVGLFGLAAAAAGRGPVTLIEGDSHERADLESNAAPTADAFALRRSVETALNGLREPGAGSRHRLPPASSIRRARACRPTPGAGFCACRRRGSSTSRATWPLWRATRARSSTAGIA